MCEECVAVDLERPCIRFAVSATEGVDGWTDDDLVEAAVLEHLLPARTGQPSGDSTGPQIDVAYRFERYRAAVGDVGELQGVARAQPEQ